MVNGENPLLGKDRSSLNQVEREHTELAEGKLRAREQWDVEYSEVPSILLSKTTLPAKPKVVVLPGR